MSSESQRSIKVRLEIEIPQGGAADSSVQRFFTISYPHGTPVPARYDWSVNQWLICTQGTLSGSAIPRSYFAGVYAPGDSGATAMSPPAGTAGQIPDSNGGGWGHDFPFELRVPNPSGSNTFRAWADYGPNDGFQVIPGTYSFTISTTGVTQCTQGSPFGSGSGSGGGIVTACSPGVSVPTTLYAHTPLSSSPFTLTYNNGNWVYNGTFGSCQATGSQTLSIGCDTNGWKLQCAGTPNVFFATSVLSNPFQILFEGVDLSHCGGTTNATLEILTS